MARGVEEDESKKIPNNDDHDTSDSPYLNIVELIGCKRSSGGFEFGKEKEARR